MRTRIKKQTWVKVDSNKDKIILPIDLRISNLYKQLGFDKQQQLNHKLSIGNYG